MKLFTLLVCAAGVAVAGSFTPANPVNLEKARAAQVAATKVAERYVLENQYILLGDYLAETNTHSVLAIADLQQHLVDMLPTQADKEVVLFQYLLALQVALQRVNGVLWWDSCAWHAEPWAIYVAQQNHDALFGMLPVSAVRPDLPVAARGKQLGVRIRAHLKR